MSPGRVGVRALASLGALGLICAFGAGGAGGADGPPAKMSITPAPGTAAYNRLANQYCHCKIPQRYRFRVAGTVTDVGQGGVQTWSIRGVLRRQVKRVPFTEVVYRPARASFTLAIKNLDVGTGFNTHECLGHHSPDPFPPPVVLNVPEQTRKLRPDNYVLLEFELIEREYAMNIGGYPYLDRGGVRGTVTCEDGAKIPVCCINLPFFEAPNRHGRPLGVVKGGRKYKRYYGYTLLYQGHWKLKAIRKR